MPSCGNYNFRDEMRSHNNKYIMQFKYDTYYASSSPSAFRKTYNYISEIGKFSFSSTTSFRWKRWEQYLFGGVKDHESHIMSLFLSLSFSPFLSLVWKLFCDLFPRSECSGRFTYFTYIIYFILSQKHLSRDYNRLIRFTSREKERLYFLKKYN